MTYVGVQETPVGEKPDWESHYPDTDDYWDCKKCGVIKPSRRYKDWFGSDDLDIEVYEYLEANLEENGTPLSVMVSGYMACVVWEDSVIVFGYDGNEYCHSFGFELEAPKKGILASFNLNPPTLKVDTETA